MPDVNTISFSHKELAEILIRQSDIHEGFWGIYLEFALSAANITIAPGRDVTPAAVVPVVKIGLQRFPEANNLTVDAAIINPAAKIEKLRKRRVKS